MRLTVQLLLGTYQIQYAFQAAEYMLDRVPLTF